MRIDFGRDFENRLDWFLSDEVRPETFEAWRVLLDKHNWFFHADIFTDPDDLRRLFEPQEKGLKAYNLASVV